jgi:hypothetical protein
MTTIIRYKQQVKMAGFLAVILMMPGMLHAQAVVTEIMYDQSGADTGHEWLEVWNASSVAIPLTEWKLFEGNTNHKIASAKGASTLAPGAYAVIADNPTLFLSDNAGYAGALFDSAFSLSNAGEALILRDAKLADMSTVTYAPSMGAGGDGNSLQRTAADGVFVPGRPTPGEGGIGTLIVVPQKPVKAPAVPVLKKTKSTKSTGSLPVGTNPALSEPMLLSDSAEETATTSVAQPAQGKGEVAAVAAAPLQPLSPWVLGLAGFIAVPVIGAIALRRKSRTSWSIVEDTEKDV